MTHFPPAVASTPWFAMGRLGPIVATPRTWEGWVATVGLLAPAVVFASRGGEVNCLLAAGLFAFLFGLAHAMAGECGAAP